MKRSPQATAWLSAIAPASADASPKAVPGQATIEGIRRLLVGALEWFGGISEFCRRLVKAIGPPFEGKELLRQMDEIGAKSLPLVTLAGAAIGVVLSLHTRDSLIRFGAKSLLPALIIMSLVKESGPIITALVVSGRVGAGIGAELGSMKVTEQIDAIEASAVNPYKFLVAPRVVACMLMLPLLSMVACFSGIVAGWAINALAEPMSFKLFLNQGLGQARLTDLLPSTFKALVFGFIIGLIGCFQGMHAQGGTEGVGRASTSAVVLSSLFVILADVVLVRIMITLFPQ
jgi:phospholipid/cholesterol/gamma-HCH transport system permease protein